MRVHTGVACTGGERASEVEGSKSLRGAPRVGLLQRSGRSERGRFKGSDVIIDASEDVVRMGRARVNTTRLGRLRQKYRQAGLRPTISDSMYEAMPDGLPSCALEVLHVTQSRHQKRKYLLT